MAGGFDSLGLMAELVRSVDEQGWILPSDVQDEAIPLIVGGGDVMVASETGSGKTAAFGLPMIQCVHERLRQSLDYKAGKGKGKAKSNNSEYSRVEWSILLYHICCVIMSILYGYYMNVI